MGTLSKILPVSLYRALLRVAHKGRVLYWRFFRPRLEGVRVLAMDPQGRVILIRHSYGSDSWMPPGGGIDKGEDPVVAGVRELREETGCRLENARELAVVAQNLHGALNRVHIVWGTTRDVPVPDRTEIVAAQAFALDALPEPMPLAVSEMIERWLPLDEDHR